MFQLEIGVQTTNIKTIVEIRRKTDLNKLSYVVGRIKAFGNIPLMHQKYKEYGMEYKSGPPYEVLYTKWLSFSEVLRLKSVEEMVEVYYNTGQFKYTMKYMLNYFDSPFDMYSIMGNYYEKHRLFDEKQSRLKRYEILYEFAREQEYINIDKLKAVLMYDLYLRENLKSRPSFCLQQPASPEILKEFKKKYHRDGSSIHVEAFEYNQVVLAERGTAVKGICFFKFDYRKRNPLNNNAMAEPEESIWQST